MSSNHNHSDQYSSRLTGSSWRPSPGPYDTTPPDSSNGNTRNSNNGGGGGYGNPTPNSLNETNARAVHFSRAEYKAPNSLQNSSPPDSGGRGSARAAGTTSSNYYGGKTPNSLNATPHDPNDDSAGADDGHLRFRESKSYMDRYADIQQQNTTPSPTSRSSRSRSAGRPSVHSRERPRHSASSSTGRYGSAGRAGSSGRNGGRNGGGDRDTTSRERFELSERYEDDAASERTPLERWELRKERKLMEQHQKPDRRHGTEEDAKQQRAVTPTRTRTAAREVTRDRSTRWSPREEEDEDVAPTTRTTRTRDDGYEEYNDEFGATSRDRQRSPGGERYHASRDGSGGRSSSDGYSDQRSGSGSRAKHRTHHSQDRTSSSSTSRRYEEPQRYHSGQQGQYESDYVTPGGNTNRSVAFHDDHDTDRNNNGRHGRQSTNEGEGSPLFNDEDEHQGSAGNIHVGDHSPLAMENHFTNERSPPPKAPARSILVNSSDDYEAAASPQRSMQSSSPNSRSSASQRSPAGSAYSGTSSNQSNGNSSRGSKSSYADDLRSFTESVTSSVAARNSSPTNQNSSPDVLRRHHDGVQYSQMMGRGGPEMAVPVSQHSSPRGSTTSSSHGNNPPHEASLEEVRVRHRASDFCERFTSRPCGSSKDHRSDSLAKKQSAKKKYMWCALVVCALCIVGAGLAIYFIGEKNKINGESSGSERYGLDGPVDEKETTSEPTVSVVPTATPSTASPTPAPTTRPTSERERLIGEYLADLSKGQSDKIGTPPYQAKMWLLREDDLNLHLPYNNNHGSDQDASQRDDSEVARRITQRFALATCYYAMGIGNGGIVKGWLEGDECREVGDYGRAWDGVGCDEYGNVRALALDGANLHGSIPHELSLLTSMENLIIKNNPGLMGPIPRQIGSHMSQLRQLGLYENNLTGSVPKDIFRLRNLVYLNLADNTLMGTIDWEEMSHHQKNLHRLILNNNFLDGKVDFHLLAKNPSITLLALSNNLFNGNVDTTVGSLENLEYLYLDGNKFVGSIPEGIGKLENLRALNLDENELYGTLPDSLGNMTSLEFFSAKSNTISGGFPSSSQKLANLRTLNLASNAMSGGLGHLSSMSSLQNVHLYQNSFTGPIDGEIFTNLPNLEVLFLSSNSLTGSIPKDIASAQRQLKGLFLSDNGLKGGIPEELCSLYKLENLFLDANDFHGMLPTCLGNLFGLQRFHAFKNRFSGHVPSGLMSLPDLVELGLEENDLTGGLHEDQTCTSVLQNGVSIWADCTELEGGCDCCSKCCSDRGTNC